MSVDEAVGTARCEACEVLLDGRAYEYAPPGGDPETLCRACALVEWPEVVGFFDGVAAGCPECDPVEDSRAARRRRAEATIRHRRGRVH